MTPALGALPQLFETGVDEMSWDDLSRGRDDWPPVRAVHEYRTKAYQVVRDVILNHPALDKQEVRGGRGAQRLLLVTSGTADSGVKGSEGEGQLGRDELRKTPS